MPKTLISIGSLMDGQDVMGWRSDTAAADRSLARHCDVLRGLTNSIDAILPGALQVHGFARMPFVRDVPHDQCAIE